MVQEILINETLINHHRDLITPVDGNPLGLLLPSYTGRHSLPLIAAGIRQLEEQRPDLVVVLASSPDDKTYLQEKGQVSSPLGFLEIDSQTAAVLLVLLPEIKPLKLTKAGQSERVNACFLVLAAFLKNILPDVKLLPLLLADNQLGRTESLAAALAEALKGQKACLIAQSGLEPSLLSAIEFNQPKEFLKIAKEGAREQKSGITPAAVLLKYTQLSGGNTITVLDENQIEEVHSASLMLWEYQSPRISGEQKEALCRFALKAIESYITRGEVPEYQAGDPVLERKTGAFVTIRINGMLRGCIGNMTAERPLVQSVQDMAVAAATSDPRFPPLTIEEIGKITIKVAILSPLQRMKPDQIEVGKHGVLISLYGQRGVLLPEVAADHYWDRETLLKNVCFKAGLPGDAWQHGAKIYGFSSIVFGTE